MNLDMDNTHSTKITSEWTTDLLVRRKTRELPEENTGENLHDLGYGDDFSDTTLRECSVREIMDKLDFIKTKNFCL